ncbi:transcriptional repressor [bacterium]|nr:transcriptional repressor [bacterium]
MREFLRTKGFKMTPQRELIFKSFFAMGKHVSVDELYDKVRQQDSSIGYSTVWRNLKLICKVGLAEEVNLGDGVTRYDRATETPHGHFYCIDCRKLTEFGMDNIVGQLAIISRENDFVPSGFKIEIQGRCRACRDKRAGEKTTAESAEAQRA